MTALPKPAPTTTAVDAPPPRIRHEYELRAKPILIALGGFALLVPSAALPLLVESGIATDVGSLAVAAQHAARHWTLRERSPYRTTVDDADREMLERLLRRYRA